MGNFKEDIAAVEAMIFDIDGVFTDGSITPIPGEDFLRSYYAKDGYAVAYAIRNGYKVFVITGGRGALLRARLEYMGVTEMHTEVTDKISVLRDIVERHGLNPGNVLYMGDDIPDLECMQEVGMPVCPSDAASEVIEASRYVSEYAGGYGCVRDVIEQVLRSHGNWAKDLKGFIGGKIVSA